MKTFLIIITLLLGFGGCQRQVGTYTYAICDYSTYSDCFYTDTFIRVGGGVVFKHLNAPPKVELYGTYTIYEQGK